MAKRISKDRAQELVAQVDLLRKQGKTADQACSEAGITENMYGYWTRKLRGERVSRKVRVLRKRERRIQVETPAPQAHLVRIWGELSGGKMTLLSDLAAA